MSQQMSWFEDEEKKKFDELPEGVYSAILSNATLDETKDEPRISIEFTLESKRKVWLNLKFSEKQKKFLNWQMRELGVYDHAKEMAMAGKPISHAFLDALGEIIGVECEVELSYREWQGKRYQSVKIESCGQGAKKTPAKTHAPASAPKSFDKDEEIPDFMR